MVDWETDIRWDGRLWRLDHLIISDISCSSYEIYNEKIYDLLQDYNSSSSSNNQQGEKEMILKYVINYEIWSDLWSVYLYFNIRFYDIGG